jgi:two-component system response regulator AtoC
VSDYNRLTNTPIAARDLILVVEDDDVVGPLLELLLSRVARRVQRVRDGAECARIFNGIAPEVALVIMDCGLPDAHGGTLCHRLRKAAPRLPVLLTSGRPQPNLLALFAADGPTDFLPKPFRPADVLERAEALLAAARA